MDVSTSQPTRTRSSPTGDRDDHAIVTEFAPRQPMSYEGFAAP
jgi:hypothetical protein